MLPDYISKAVPNPTSNRAPWYVNTAPTYAGVFLWVAFYQSLAGGAIDRAGLGTCMLALAVAGALSYALYYYAPAVMGMKTGLPLYVIGSSTFGTLGGYVMPGLLMGLLQIGWFAVGTFFATRFILGGLGLSTQTGTALFTVVAVIWGYSMTWIGAKGIQYVAKVALYLNGVAFLMVLVVFAKTAGGLGQHAVDPAKADPFAAFTFLVQAVIGFFATAGAAGADFGMNSRDERDVRWGGLVGVALAILYAGGLPILSVAGARAMNPQMTGFSYDGALASLGGFLASSTLLLFAITSIPSACFCAFIAGNSFSTMIPGVKRISSMMIGMTLAIALAVTGVAENLIGFFTIVGASFGPICGAMAADYLLSGRKWAGPRKGVSIAGYGAWAIGFVVGILPFLPVSESVKSMAQPAVVYSFITGFAVYAILAKMGLEPAPAEEAARGAAS
ncbi:MAG: cytosine permease [Acidobacteria bacterium]|nr:cytosine permease [Acidobacteriota bacterium]